MKNKILKCFNVAVNDEIKNTNHFLNVEILIKNIKNLDMNDVHVLSNFNNNFEYIKETLYFNDIKLNDIRGINNIQIDEIYVNEIIKISYKLKCKKMNENSKLEFLLFYKKNEKIYNEKKILVMKKRSNKLDIKISKKADKKNVIVGDIVNFVINMKNTSDKIIKNIEIIDLNKTCIKIIKNSLYYNGVLINSNELSKGIYRDLLDINEELNIKFSAVVNESNDEEIFNFVKLSYEYNNKFNNTIYVNDEFRSESIKIYKKFESKKTSESNYKNELDCTNKEENIICIENFKIKNEVKSDIFLNIECIIRIKEFVDIEDFYLIQESQFKNKLCVIGNIRREIQYFTQKKSNQMYEITIENKFIEYISIFNEYKTGSITNLVAKSKILVHELRKDKLEIESIIYLEIY